jgi:hypothetical protein
LRQGQNAAFVRGDAAGSPPLVRIAVSGPVATRRELLAVIRREFTKINGNITGLEVSERVPVPGYNGVPLNYDDLVAAEAAGKKAWPIVVDGVYNEIPLAGLLDGIEPKAARKARASRISPAPGIHVEGDLVLGGKHMQEKNYANTGNNTGIIGDNNQ